MAIHLKFMDQHLKYSFGPLWKKSIYYILVTFNIGYLICYLHRLQTPFKKKLDIAAGGNL